MIVTGVPGIHLIVNTVKVPTNMIEKKNNLTTQKFANTTKRTSEPNRYMRSAMHSEADLMNIKNLPCRLCGKVKCNKMNNCI